MARDLSASVSVDEGASLRPRHPVPISEPTARVGQGFGPEMLGGSGHPERLEDDSPERARLVTVRDGDAALIERESRRASVPSADGSAILGGMAGRRAPVVVDALRPAAAFTSRFSADA
jgi:hypothetical protein